MTLFRSSLLAHIGKAMNFIGQDNNCIYCTRVLRKDSYNDCAHNSNFQKEITCQASDNSMDVPRRIPWMYSVTSTCQ